MRRRRASPDVAGPVGTATALAHASAVPGHPMLAPGYQPRRAYRSSDDAMIGGIAAGMAEHLALPVLWVRAGFLVLLAFGGAGAFLYAGLWLVLPARKHTDPLPPGLDAATRQGKRSRRRERLLVDYGPLVALGAIAFGVLVLITALTGQTFAVAPALIGVTGVAVLWRQADEAQRERWLDSSGRINPLRAVVGNGGWAAYLRIVAGVLLLITAITLFSLRSGSLTVALNVGLASALGIVGLGFMVGPWLFRLSSDLSEEREARVRSEERADVAAHLHDSVLQTLALIQRSAGDASAVTRLARAQERDLRSWLFDDPGEGPTTLAAALREAAAAVEDSHGVHVEVVCVGDARVAEEERPLLLAAREAMTNAARHSGAETVDVYAEATPAGVEVFVRDRGAGFDQGAVAEDRQGIRSSIVGRMERHGGTATLRSTPGQGTEIRLFLPARPDSHQEAP